LFSRWSLFIFLDTVIKPDAQVAVGYDDNDGNSWSTLGVSQSSRALRLHELSDSMLSLILLACETGLADWQNGSRQKKSHHVDKFRITHASVQSIIHQREHPRALTRRLDFVPHDDFIGVEVTDEMLSSACFADSEVAWLTMTSPLPPVQMWAGHNMERFGLRTLVALFSRALRDDCCTSIQAGSVPAVYEARLTARNRLRLMNPAQGSKASVHKGRLVWLAEDSKLESRFLEEWNQQSERPLGLRGFHTNFSVGSMHMIDAMDVTNSKMDIHPSVDLPQHETEAEAATRAEPEAEIELLPGATDENIVT
jgi:hypothetical protein